MATTMTMTTMAGELAENLRHAADLAEMAVEAADGGNDERLALIAEDIDAILQIARRTEFGEAVHRAHDKWTGEPCRCVLSI